MIIIIIIQHCIVGHPPKCDNIQYLHLFLEHGVVSGDDVDVEVPDPVGDQHGEGEGEEDDQGGGLQRPAALQQRQHRHQQHHPQADVQVPAPCVSIIASVIVIRHRRFSNQEPKYN